MIETSTTATTVLLFITFIAFVLKRGLTYMHIYQQEEYDSGRLFKWIIGQKVFDKRASLAIIIAAAVGYFTSVMIAHFIIFMGFAMMTYREPDPRKESKKNFVMTARARRIYSISTLISIVLSVWVFIAPQIHWLWLLNVQLIPVMIILANALLFPYEQRNQKKFWKEAHDKVMDLRPTIIAITGSYGKTSVKHILGHILKLSAPTLITPGSVNTPMGISRIIREQLNEDHKYLVVEMGAYGHGSIERLCKLTPPDMGIITAIGHAHYERFKTLEAVAETKYELAKAVLKSEEGQVIAHERTLKFEYARDIKNENPARFIICGDTPNVDNSKNVDKSYLESEDLQIHAVQQMPKGIEVRFTWKNTTHIVTAPLYGLHHGHNLVLAFVAACELGISYADIQTSLNMMPQIQHRLEVKPNKADGTVIIDDAYNSNPIGFQSALGLLAQLGQKGRKILITPGMVELGKAHKDAHQRIGEYAGEVCDVAIIVNGKRIPSFIDGFKKTGGDKQMHEVSTFSDAQKWIAKNKQDGDIILVENDLPDLYERIPKI